MERSRFEALVAEAIDRLPDYFFERIDNVEIRIARWPTRAQAASVGIRSRYGLLGLYEGIPLTERGINYGLVPPDVITLFQEPIVAYCGGDEEAIRREVEDTLIHELGHFFGIDEDRMAELEAERDAKRAPRRHVVRRARRPD